MHFARITLPKLEHQDVTCTPNNLVLEEELVRKNYPLKRILHVVSLIVSALIVILGIHILMEEDEFKNELYFYWFVAVYVMITMVVKMFLVVKSDLVAKKIILAFLVEFAYFLPIVLNDWTTHEQHFALAMLLTNIARVTYYIFAVTKDSDLA